MTNQEILLLAKDTIRIESEAVASISAQLDENFVLAAQALLECKGHVLVAGSGTSRSVGERLAHLLSCCGTPALFIHPGDSQHGLAGALRAEDTLIALSKGGETVEVNYLAGVAKKRGAKLIALTEKPESTLGKLSDICLKVVAPEGVDPYGMIATGSSLVNSAFGDALCVVLLKLRGYSLAEFSETHPGGAVGKKIKGNA
ncbi:MAG: SIS domain-containing protein [Anaerolineaceae bacterium]|jgi:arabinose-5-phosphate isomerase|nr:SIS domain-containing protein [Anaerolineaceae bacterium]